MEKEEREQVRGNVGKEQREGRVVLPGSRMLMGEMNGWTVVGAWYQRFGGSGGGGTQHLGQDNLWVQPD